MNSRRLIPCLLGTLVLLAGCLVTSAKDDDAARSHPELEWKDNMLTVRASWLPGESIEIWYLEAFCRPGSTDREWERTLIPHTTRDVTGAAAAAGEGVAKREIALESLLDDGVVVRHRIRSVAGGVDFELVAENPTDRPSEAHWAQPCVRVGAFTGTHADADKYTYVPKCFVFIDGKQTFLPTSPWATRARYTPGQVWCPKDVPRDDVNPRPLSPLVPSNGLIGCVSGDGEWLLATAWEPYQELFQGVARCIHSDFRIGGLEAGATKRIRGRLYLVPNDIEALLARYSGDFPEHAAVPPKPSDP